MSLPTSPYFSKGPHTFRAQQEDFDGILMSKVSFKVKPTVWSDKMPLQEYASWLIEIAKTLVQQQQPGNVIQIFHISAGDYTTCFEYDGHVHFKYVVSKFFKPMVEAEHTIIVYHTPEIDFNSGFVFKIWKHPENEGNKKDFVPNGITVFKLHKDQHCHPMLKGNKVVASLFHCIYRNDERGQYGTGWQYAIVPCGWQIASRIIKKKIKRAAAEADAEAEAEFQAEENKKFKSD